MSSSFLVLTIVNEKDISRLLTYLERLAFSLSDIVSTVVRPLVVVRLNRKCSILERMGSEIETS